MAKRTTFTTMLQDDSRIISGGWAAHPEIKREVADHLIFGLQGREPQLHSLALASYDFKDNLLSEVKSKLPAPEGLRPLKIAAHPGGSGVVVSFDTGCKLFEWQEPSELINKQAKEVELKLQPSETVLTELEDAGPQNCLVFNGDGSLLATGGEDGHIRVFHWPSMVVILNLPKAYKSVKDLDISYDSAFLSATGENSPCRIWDLSTAENIATLQPDAGESFGFSRFSRNAKKPFLFVTLTKQKRGYLGVWDLSRWDRIGAKKFLAEPIVSFAITHHGRRLAMGTKGGDIFIVLTENMQLQQTINNAHSRGVTSLEFSPNNKAVLSLSVDYTCRVSAIDLSKEWKEWQLYLVLLALFLGSIVLFYLLYEYGDDFFQAPPQRTFEPSTRPPIEDNLMNDGGHEEL